MQQLDGATPRERDTYGSSGQKIRRFAGVIDETAQLLANGEFDSPSLLLSQRFAKVLQREGFRVYGHSMVM